MLNLKTECGKRYKVLQDESWKLERSDFKTPEDEPWYYELRSKTACLYPFTTEEFCVLWTGLGSKELKRLSLRHKRLDGEVLYFFNNSALKAVLSHVEFYKKRQVTDAMREAGKRLAQRYGFKK